MIFDMKAKYFIIIIVAIAFTSSCNESSLKYKLYSNGKFVFEILPKDIEFYDTTQYRNGIEIHELRLKDSFYKKDSILLEYPLFLNCYIKGKKYFWSDFFRATQSQSRFWINFHFRSSCENWWTFPEKLIDNKEFEYLRPGDTLVLHTDNKCNSIEFFHRRKDIEESLDDYYMKQKYFKDYIDTARLAHEILYDPYYLNALKESGVLVK